MHSLQPIVCWMQILLRMTKPGKNAHASRITNPPLPVKEGNNKNMSQKAKSSGSIRVARGHGCAATMKGLNPHDRRKRSLNRKPCLLQPATLVKISRTALADATDDVTN